MLSSPIPASGQATIRQIPGGGIHVIEIRKSDTSGILWVMFDVQAGETHTCIIEK